MTFNEFKNNVQLWAAERGIYDHSTTEAQLMKALSELGELADAIIKGDDEALKDAVGDIAVCVVNAAYMAGVSLDEVPEWLGYIAKKEPSAEISSDFAVGCIAEGIGSYLVGSRDKRAAMVYPIGKLAELCDHEQIDFTACCEHAWNQIKDRKGRMVAGGAFVKDEDEKKQDGGPELPGGEVGGMTLRDYFAAKAMQGVLSNFNGNVGVGNDETNSGISACAYAIADAMLKERSK